MRPRELSINRGWQLQSSTQVAAGGEVVSTPSAPDSAWIPTDLPATVLGALVDHGLYPDPFYADNLRRIPGQGPFAQNFSNHEMPNAQTRSVSITNTGFNGASESRRLPGANACAATSNRRTLIIHPIAR